MRVGDVWLGASGFAFGFWFAHAPTLFVLWLLAIIRRASARTMRLQHPLFNF
jgi:hypothetical protein